jgi:threonine/homoserine/homoserine lactone efflux protein
MLLFLQGLLIGFSIAAPVGPIGVLCIRRSLAYGRQLGFASGLGAATADAFYGAVAGFGLTFISGFLVAQQDWLRLVGGFFLLYLGLRTAVTRPTGEALTDHAQPTLISAFFSTFLLTLTNPITILSFAAIFAGLGIAAEAGDYLQAVVLVLGVFLGSAAWWFLLSGTTGFFRDRITSTGLLWINRISGLIILGFGLVALTSFFT